ncbi:MAG TPA: FkbM family methyltransferase [Burkholderiaceae bacterium]|nr:FkbM family methyltransferase [Burkholderiaceae bacterium]
MNPFVSYAQNLEDVLLWRALRDVKNGFYVDVGANSPIIDSVSLAFYEHGWQGVNVEPSHAYHDELRSHRPRDLNIHAAVGAQHGLIKFFDVIETGLSTTVEEVAQRHAAEGFEVREELTTVLTLDDLFAQLPDRDIHWMKIDVEGAEDQVLAGWKDSTVHPWIVVVESVEPADHSPSHHSWEPGLLDKGYQFVYFDGLNRYYVWEQQSHLAAAFQVGPNLFDGFTISGTATSTFSFHLKYELAKAEEENNDLRQQVATFAVVHARMQALEAQLLGVINERDRANADLQSQAQHVADAQAEVRRLRASEEDALAAWQLSGQMLEERSAQLHQAQAKVHELLGSSSWKVTAPMRMMISLMRGSRAGASQYFHESLRYFAQIGIARRLARAVLPENSRLKRALVARAGEQPQSTVFTSAQQNALSSVAGNQANSQSKLLNRLERRLHAAHPRWRARK